ncbi:restriction endonuclease [Microbacterium sp. 11MF]|uniref:restriction endonuclease n=1 Tax=Microbacterium sp. 11MF TaxID=1169146 RepID=UPI0009DBE447|nr:restriction endonuclease [Microbacterium sp. 11MF]
MSTPSVDESNIRMPASAHKTPLPTYAEIRTFYDSWRFEPHPVPMGWKQHRGYAFEHILNSLFTLEGLRPRTNYRPAGEEIDGSLIVDHRIYLLEAKWWGAALPASALYAFKGKIDGKLAGTLGIVISQSGFADDAVDALVSGKGVNMILFDSSDLETILSEQMSFADALRQKLRYAAEFGQPFSPLRANAAPSATSTPDHETAQRPASAPVNVIVEGPADEAGLRELLNTLSPRVSARTAIWPARGVSNLIPLSLSLAQKGVSDVDIFVDSGLLEPSVVEEIATGARDSGANLITFAPSFIDVLERACETDYYNLVPATGIPAKHARRMAQHTNSELLWEASPELHGWWLQRTANLTERPEDSA